MTIVTDFFEFKYCKTNFYTDLFINRSAVLRIEQALDEILSDMDLRKDEWCAYMRLKELCERSRRYNHSRYVRVNINKCYINYIKELSIYFYDRIEYSPIKIVSNCLVDVINEDITIVNDFLLLSEETKTNILSKI